MQALQDYGEEAYFSTRYRKDFVSWIDIGAPDTQQQTSAPVALDCLDDFFWSHTNQGVRFGSNEAQAFTYEMMEEGTQINGGIYTIFDTGASSIFLSVLWYESFIEQLYSITGIPYEVYQGTAVAGCSGFYPDIYFMIDGYWLQVQPEDYIKETNEGNC